VSPALHRSAVRFAPLLAVAAACAGSGGAARQDQPAAAPTRTEASASALAAAPRATPPAATPAPRRELSPRAQRLFDEAVAAEAEQKRLKVPTDWEILERRWRAVVDAEAVPEAWFNLGVVLEQRRRPDEARAAYRRALALDPKLAPAAVNLAMLEEPKDPRDQLQVWTELLRRYPEDPVPRLRLAALYEAAGQHEEAWRLGREALARDPRAVGAYKVLMRVALSRGQPDLAQLLVVKARKLDDADPEIVAFGGDVLLRQKDEPGAVVQWKKAVSLRDDYLPARYALLSNALAKHQWEAVAEQARAILRSEPQAARVQVVLGIAYRYLGQPDKALAAYDQAEKLAGSRLPEVHLARAVAFMKAKDQCEPAVAELQRYVATAGPAVATEGPARKLLEECTQIIAANKAAEDAARQMKADAEKDAARKAAASNGAKPEASRETVQAAPSDGRAAPTR
jgi:tetratricopeptide (TPR) repeat protein